MKVFHGVTAGYFDFFRAMMNFYNANFNWNKIVGVSRKSVGNFATIYRFLHFAIFYDTIGSIIGENLSLTQHRVNSDS